MGRVKCKISWCDIILVPKFVYAPQVLSSETHGQLVGAKESRNARKKIEKQLCECWLLIGQKNPLYYTAQSAGSRSTVRFVCSNTKPTQKPIRSPYCIWLACSARFYSKRKLHLQCLNVQKKVERSRAYDVRKKPSENSEFASIASMKYIRVHAHLPLW